LVSTYPNTLLPLFSSSSLLQEGDLILTGTPSGIGPIQPGDEIECLLSDPHGKELAQLNFGAVDRHSGYHYQPSSS
jgi:acylpyruvate hydrolase